MAYGYFLDCVCILSHAPRTIIIITMGHEIIDMKKNHLKSWSLSKNSVVPLTLNYICECITPENEKVFNIMRKWVSCYTGLI